MSRLVADRLQAPACVIESDWWWTTIVSGRIPPWLAEAHAQNRAVVQSFAAAASVMASRGFATVLDGIIGPWMLDLVLAEADAASLEVHYVVLRPTLEVALNRALERAGEERVAGHPALSDPEPIRQLWHQFSELGALEKHVLDNTALDPEKTAAQVVSLVGERITIVASDDRAEVDD